jgi:hypothetical protein
MSRDRFRPAAITARSAAIVGEPLRHTPPVWGWIVWLLVIFTVLAIVAMATLTFSRTEFIQGRLSPQSAEARMLA